jgi:hypothetical protein
MPDQTEDIARSHRELEEKIRQRAEEIYRTRNQGSDLDNWLLAEKEVLGEGAQPAQDRGTTVGWSGRPLRTDTETLGSG